MSVWFWTLFIAVALIGWLVAYMLAQRPITNAQQPPAAQPAPGPAPAPIPPPARQP